MQRLEKVFDSVERCHTILNDLFPHEGTRAVGGSRIFIGTPLFAVLKSCIRDIRKHLQKCGHFQLQNELILLWSGAEDLVVRIEQEGRHGDMEQINGAAIILYLACGTTWNVLQLQTNKVPPHNKNYVRVEPMAQLFIRCEYKRRIQEPVDFQVVVGYLTDEINKRLTQETRPLGPNVQ
jgi:hypothetical protein